MAIQTAHPVETGFSQRWPARDWCDSHAVLAVSGGADSVAMLRAAVALKKRSGGSGRLFVAHLDHGLRGDASTADAAWLETLCVRLGVPFEWAKSDVTAIADRQGDGLEAAARSARYEFLRSTAEKLGARFVAVAHTADDQVETILHRILRGTGIDGLRGMPAIRSLSSSVTLVRPLLAVRRRDVIDYLASIGQDVRSDATNVNLRWTRNRIRHQLIPAIGEYSGSDIGRALLRLASQAAETHDFIAAIAAEQVDGCVTLNYGSTQTPEHQHVCGIRISCQALAAQPPLIVREVCKWAWHVAGWPRQAMGYDQWQQLADLISGESDSPPVNLPGDVRAGREGADLVLERHGLP